MAAILHEEDFEMVRKAIGVEVKARILPSPTIALPIYQGAAERWARETDPNLDENLTDEKKAQVIKNAVALKTASLLVIAFPFLMQEQFGRGSGFTRQAVDRDQLAESLASRAGDELNSYLNPGGNSTASFLPAFALASGRRGQ